MGKAIRQHNGQVEVHFSPEDRDEAYRVADMRHKSHREVGRKDTKSRPQDNGLDIDRLGALGEKAVSIAIRLPWDGSYKPLAEWDSWRREGHDVSGLEVKSVEYHGRCLPLHADSKPDLPAVLVHVESPYRATLVGWILTRDGLKDEYQLPTGDIPRGCYMVPPSELRPMAELFALLKIPMPDPEPEITSADFEAFSTASI